MADPGGNGAGETDLLDPARSALVVVDMQNDYCHDDGAFGRAGHDLGSTQASIGRIDRLAAAARAAGVTVVLIQNTVDRQGRMRPALHQRRRKRLTGSAFYVVDGTWGHAITDGIQVADDDLVIRKYASSAFIGTPLDQTLRIARVETVVVVGVVTWGCVMATAQSAATLGYTPVVVEDCVAGSEPDLHDAALRMMRRSFGDDLVVDSDSIVATWLARPVGSAVAPGSASARPETGD